MEPTLSGTPSTNPTFMYNLSATGNKLIWVATLATSLAGVTPALRVGIYSQGNNISEQIHPWELQLQNILHHKLPGSPINEGALMGMYMKPIPVRRFRIKAKIISIRKGNIKMYPSPL